MAGPNGPIQGCQHEHYVGVNTMSDDAAITLAVFDALDALLAQGKHILIPIWHGKYPLGTGIAADQPRWTAIQRHIFEHPSGCTWTLKSPRNRNPPCYSDPCERTASRTRRRILSGGTPWNMRPSPSLARSTTTGTAAMF